MRFCMITTFYPPYSFGGDGSFVRALSKLLAGQGHHVEVIHCADSFRTLGGEVTATTASAFDNIRVHTLQSPFGVLSPLATHQTGLPLFKWQKIKSILEAGNFDVIHFHNISLAGGPGLLRLGRGIKLYTLHEHWLICPMHTLFRDNREPCEEKHCFRCSINYRRPPQLWRYTNLLSESVRHVDRFIAPTAHTRSLHVASKLPMKIVTIPNFHLPGVAGLPANSGRPYFLYAGRLERLKGVHTLIPVFQSYGMADLVIAGAGGEGNALREQARGVSNIRFAGHLEQPQLANLYRGAVAVLVPSLATEVFPLTILEAFAAATPVIARAHGPLPEILDRSGGGMLFRSESELPALFERLRTEPGIRNRLGKSGQEAGKTEWGPDRHLERYFSLIHELRR